MKALLRRARLNAEWWLVLAAALALTALAVRGQWTARLDFAAYDLALRQSERPAPAGTLIVAIDDASLAQAGAWPWPREVQAALVARIAAARPRALGLDILLSEPRGETGDAALAAALADAASGGTRLVLPAAFRVPGPDGTAFALDAPLPRFTASGAAIGHVNLSPDPDGVIRRFYRAYGGGGRSWPALPAAMLGQPAPATSGAALVGTGPLLIGYAGPPGSFPTVPAAALLRGEVPPALLAGKDVLVGVTASGLGDYHAAPTGGGTLMAGVEIQANALATLRTPRPVRPAPPALAYALALLPLALLFAAMRRLPPRLTGPVALALALLVVCTCWALLHLAAIWLAPVTALAALALAWPLWAWRKLAIAGTYIARELERTAALAESPAAPTEADGLGFLDRQLVLLEAATLREARLRAEHDEVIRLLSHDMRSPQSAILALIESHGETPVPPETTRRIRDHARRTLALSDGFVHLTRAQLLDFAPELLDLAELARDAADAVWAQAKDRGMRLEVTAPENGEVLVMGEPALLQRMIVNLAENAIKYGTPATPVGIALRAGSGTALLEVVNTGADIPQERQSELFERFTRAGTQAARTPGVGLGLSFVHTVASRHGGTVSCRSEAGETRFSVSLPLAPQ